MKWRDLLRRAAGKPPGYLVRRGLHEARRRIAYRQLIRRVKALDPHQVAAGCGAGSCCQIWRDLSPRGFLLSSDRRNLVRSILLAEGAEKVDELKRSAEQALEHKFDLLGSGPVSLGREIDWHRDFKSGRRWELAPSHSIDYVELDRPSDVKVPWELSRCQHLVTLGRAWTVFQDRRYIEEFVAQIRSWLADNPVGLGVNWACTMDVALRAKNWVVAAAFFQDALDEPFWDDLLLALYRHGLWIQANLEHGPVNGNHFIADALGLVACGAVFRSAAEGRGWLDEGNRLLEREIPFQVDREGVNIEASTAYHRLALEIFLAGRWLLSAAGKKVSARYDDRLEGMFEYLHAYIAPNGLAPVIGDADDGRALCFGEVEIRDHRSLLAVGTALFDRPEWTERSGRRLWEDLIWLVGQPPHPAPSTNPPEAQVSTSFPESGFHILRTPQQYLFIDAGPVGFKGLGGHGHNDCLSFEWHACGRPLLTDSGTYVYTASPTWRNRFRSTEFHNTVRVDGEEINRFPSPDALWSLRDDAHPFEARLFPDDRWVIFEASHDGYRRLSDPVTISRRWMLNREDSQLRLRDRIDGRKEHRVEFFFHGATDAKPLTLPDRGVGFEWDDGTRCTLVGDRSDRLAWELRQGWFSPSYGVKIPRPVWVAVGLTKLPLEVTWDLGASRSI